MCHHSSRDRKSFRDIVATMEAVYKIKIKTKRQGSLAELFDQMKAQNYHPVLYVKFSLNANQITHLQDLRLTLVNSA
jgi:hypothetical protein